MAESMADSSLPRIELPMYSPVLAQVFGVAGWQYEHYVIRMSIRLFLPYVFLCLCLAGTTVAQSARPGMGAIPYADAGGTGVTFRTWAPNATAVSVHGSFNGWGSTPLVKEATGGLWSVDSSRARVGDNYKFEINGNWKKDPRGKRVVNSNGNSIIYDPQAFNWGSGTNFNAIWRNDLVIYEMHVGTFNGEDWLPSTFDECIEKIPHLKTLGVSAVQLMPVMEFPGDFSWGYNPSDPYAVESSFGGPDGLKRFVKACHENGIAVLMDVVHNHYGPTDLQLWQYDGWSQNGLGGIYFYNEKWKASTMWGDTRPDFGRQEVKDYIHGQIRMFVEEYHIDGFRWDSVYNIRHFSASNAWNQAGSTMLAQVNDWLAANHPDVIRIAEDHAFDSPVNFEAEWDHGFLNDIRWLAAAASDSDRNMNTLAFHLGNGGLNRVVYVESHDTCGDLNDKHRLPYDIDNGNPEGYWAKKRALLGNMIVLVSPGIPMIFAGSEMHEWYTFSNNQALRWGRTNTYAGIVKAYGDLIRLRRNVHGNTAGFKQPGNVNVHHVDNTRQVVGLIRWDQGGMADDIVVAINCSATARTDYTMEFPSAGTWFCLYNSDLQTYDSEFGNVGPVVNGPVVATPTARLDLGAYSMQIYSKTPLPQDSAATFVPPVPDGCGSSVQILYDPADGPLATAANVFAFLGRNNWQNPSNLPMAATNGNWTLDYVIPELTYELNLSFTDGAEAWDNNEGLNWVIPVLNCGDLPAEVVWEPHAPSGCIPLEITYRPNGGPLMGATNVFLHVGHNIWKDVSQWPLTQTGDNEWQITYPIPEDTWQVDFVFFTQTGPTDDDRIWDNNNYADWHALVQNCLRANEPSLVIINPAPLISVSNPVISLPLQGTANLLAGHLRWTNQHNGAAGSVAYATNWSIPAVPLAEGLNLIRVSGTNSSHNANHGAWDSPTNAVYAVPVTWDDDSNGGTGFQPWLISGGATALLAVSNSECSFGTHAWALQASNGGFVQAIRPFAAPLVPGDKVSFVFENGGIDGGPGNSSVGVAFENRFDQRLTEILFNGGDTNYVINGLEWRNTGIPWGTNAKTCTLEMLTELTYRFTINGQAFEGELAEKSELLISRIRFWNWNAGTGFERRYYIGDLSITGAPLPVLTYSAEVAVTRAPSDRREIQSFALAPTGFEATVNNVAGTESNVWVADTLLGGGWNWALLPASDYTISNNTITFTPDPACLFRIYSVGQPGAP